MIFAFLSVVVGSFGCGWTFCDAYRQLQKKHPVRVLRAEIVRRGATDLVIVRTRENPTLCAMRMLRESDADRVSLFSAEDSWPIAGAVRS